MICVIFINQLDLHYNMQVHVSISKPSSGTDVLNKGYTLSFMGHNYYLLTLCHT